MITERDFSSMIDRYAFDFGRCSMKNGWAQIDTSQDASYYGTWASPDELVVISYCEGDITIKKAETAAEFVEEIRAIKAWNDESGYVFKGIDAGIGEELPAKFRAIGLGDLLH